jgi:hypothetical protein
LDYKQKMLLPTIFLRLGQSFSCALICKLRQVLQRQAISHPQSWPASVAQIVPKRIAIPDARNKLSAIKW